MNVGIFTDTYFPQVSGVATSIKTLKDQLERQGNQVYIFTTTDPHVNKKAYERNIFRFSSIPFISFTDRRIAYRGLFRAYQIAKKLNLNIIHTQTEFSMGIIGKYVARKLKIPCLHTYHTMYEDYLHYIANGKLVKPIHVKEATLAFCHNMTGIVAPSKRVLNTLTNYGVKSPIRVIPTGIDVSQYDQRHYFDVRPKLGISKSTKILLSVSRVAYEKNIHELINAMPKIIEHVPNSKLVIVGDGPAKNDLEQQVRKMHLESYVLFTGQIDNDHVNEYYHMADIFVSTSNSESQGLTYIEAMAAGLKVVVVKTPYTDSLLDNETLGQTFSTENEYIHDVINYIKYPEKYKLTNEHLREQKLKAISAEYFGTRIINFYHASQLAYEDQRSHLGEIDF